MTTTGKQYNNKLFCLDKIQTPIVQLRQSAPLEMIYDNLNAQMHTYFLKVRF